MPRPIPDSYRLAERARRERRRALHLAPAVRPTAARCGSGHSTRRRESRPSQCARNRSNAAVDRRRLGEARDDVGRALAAVEVREQERERLALAGLEQQVDLVRADRVPAVGDAAGRAAGERHARLVQALVDADERVARGVEAVDGPRAGEQRPVVAPLARTGRVQDPRAVRLDLDLADRVRPLEVRRVGERVVEAELDVREQAQLLRRVRQVADGRPPHLDVLAGRDEEEQLDLDAVARADDPRVAGAVAALVAVERRLRRLPARVPDRAAVVDVQVAADGVERRVVVAVAGQPPVARVAPEGVAAAGVRAEADEVVLAAEVVEPRQRRVRALDDVLACRVVEVAVGGHAAARAERCRAIRSRYQRKLAFGTRSSVG